MTQLINNIRSLLAGDLNPLNLRNNSGEPIRTIPEKRKEIIRIIKSQNIKVKSVKTMNQLRTIIQRHQRNGSTTRTIEGLAPELDRREKYQLRQATINNRLTKWLIFVEVIYEYHTGESKIINQELLEITKVGKPTEEEIKQALDRELQNNPNKQLKYRGILSFVELYSKVERVMGHIGQINSNQESEIQSKYENTCVPDFLFNRLSQFQTPYLNYNNFVSRFYADINQQFDTKVSTEVLHDYIQKNHKYVTLIEIDGFGGIVRKTLATSKINKTRVIQLGYINHNNHLIPINNEHAEYANKNVSKHIPEKLGLCLVNIDYEKFIFQDQSPDFTKGDETTVLLIGLSLEIVLSIFKQKYPHHIIPGLSHAKNAFLNPVTNGTVICIPDYESRKMVYDDIKSKINPDIIEFNELRYHTIAKMGRDLFATECFLEKSYINPMIYDCKLRHAPKPNNEIIRNPMETQNLKTIDIRGSYKSGILKYFKNEFLPVYDGTENIEPAVEPFSKVGEYLVKQYGSGECLFKNQWVSHIAIQELLKNGDVIPENIIYQHISHNQISANPIIDFVEKVYAVLPKDTAKSIFTNWYGGLNNHTSHQDLGMMTNSQEDISYYYQNYPGVKITNVGNDSYAISIKKNLKNNYNHTPVYNAIINTGQLNLIELYKTISKNKGVSIKNFMTDSITFSVTADADSNENYDQEKYKLEKSKERFKNPNENYNPPKIEYNKEEIKVQEYTVDNPGVSQLVFGRAGVGKSSAIKRIYSRLTGNTLVCAYTHSAAQNLKDNGIPCSTIDSFFGYNPDTDNNSVEAKQKSPVRYNNIIIDEYGMLSKSHWRKFFEYKQKNPDTKFFIFGDSFQTQPLTEFKMMIERCDVITGYLCDNNIFEIKPHSKMRCDKKIFNALSLFLETGILPKCFLKNETKLENKITISASRKVNSEYNNHHAPKMIPGTKVICVKTDPKYFKNGQRFVVEKVSNSEIFVDNTWAPLSHFELDYAQTIYKYQGLTIQEPVNIIPKRAWGLMTKQELYTSISRATKMSYICIDKMYAGVQFQDAYNNTNFKKTLDTSPKITYIYKRFDFKSIYIGMTDNTERRKKEHSEKKDNLTFEVLYKCLSGRKYESMEIQKWRNQDSLKLLNVQQNQEGKIERQKVKVEIPKSNSFIKALNINNDLDAGIKITKTGKYRLRKGKFDRTFATKELAIAYKIENFGV